MNPSDYPSPNSLMFGGGARWPGTDPDEYRPFDSNIKYDPEFSKDSYGLSDMEPSPARAPAPPRRAAADASGSATKKKRTRQRAQKLPLPERNEEFAPGRTNYNLDETKVLTRCWINISEDLVFANNQRQIAYWERIADKYNEAKPPAAYKCHWEQLRKHWNQVQVNLFSVEYEKCQREQVSGESLADVRDKAIAT